MTAIITDQIESSLFSTQELETLAKAASILKSKLYISEQPALVSPQLVKSYCQFELAALDHEVFGALFLDNQHRVRVIENIFTGSLHQAAIYPREMVKKALQHNAAAVILFHNHPSGTIEPSQSDRRVTRRLTDALALIEVKVLDHFVVSFEGVTSFAERGWI